MLLLLSVERILELLDESGTVVRLTSSIPRITLYTGTWVTVNLVLVTPNIEEIKRTIVGNWSSIDGDLSSSIQLYSDGSYKSNTLSHTKAISAGSWKILGDGMGDYWIDFDGQAFNENDRFPVSLRLKYVDSKTLQDEGKSLIYKKVE